MNLKNIDYEYRSIDFLDGEQYRDEFKKLNPKEEVPALLIDNHLLVQSVNTKSSYFSISLSRLLNQVKTSIISYQFLST